ncbi:RNA polymerase sigma factor [Cryobacterium sp. TMT1-3]|uniref:RNA polymerase sigma factor n=1 Tax=Cryobacterium luteum TaxID=1424661 RepID=A0A1H8LI46_9MICO|nr:MULTISPECIES: RNA polymerase sigma factor [Cryobacterium]TFB92910.1 RNA polymerase sigma factor [Cryobacterium luteum]TFC28354.1 RNA polymerase sigma factor [Cryobacterium sp. TMT1-3]SEO04882.1 RNA polymerase sigma-70 factor, ECF subfamily [Cryobacterium luteum]
MQVATVVKIRPNSQTDQELIDQCIDGDRREFATIFRRHSRIVYAVAITVLRNPTDAEDVLSDTFLTLWRKRATVNFIEDSALPWLIATARYQAMNRRRTASREASISLNDEIDTHSSAGADVIAAEQQLTRRLDDIIAGLRPLEQRIVQLCLVNNLSYEQAATKLGVSHATVRNRLSRARSQLRHELQLQEDSYEQTH